jgi:hypothetical protein
MKTFDEKQLSDLLDAGKYQEAEQLLRESLTSELTEDERGAIMLKIISISLDASNQVNRRYIAALKDATAALKNLKADEVRGKIASM